MTATQGYKVILCRSGSWKWIMIEGDTKMPVGLRIRALEGAPRWSCSGITLLWLMTRHLQFGSCLCHTEFLPIRGCRRMWRGDPVFRASNQGTASHLDIGYQTSTQKLSWILFNEVETCQQFLHWTDWTKMGLEWNWTKIAKRNRTISIQMNKRTFGSWSVDPDQKVQENPFRFKRRSSQSVTWLVSPRRFVWSVRRRKEASPFLKTVGTSRVVTHVPRTSTKVALRSALPARNQSLSSSSFSHFCVCKNVNCEMRLLTAEQRILWFTWLIDYRFDLLINYLPFFLISLLH